MITNHAAQRFRLHVQGLGAHPGYLIAVLFP